MNARTLFWPVNAEARTVLPLGHAVAAGSPSEAGIAAMSALRNGVARAPREVGELIRPSLPWPISLADPGGRT